MSKKRRERWDLGDGAYMDISIDPDASAETVAALRQLGELAVRRMRDESLTYDETEIPERGTPFRLASRPPALTPDSAPTDPTPRTGTTSTLKDAQRQGAVLRPPTPEGGGEGGR